MEEPRRFIADSMLGKLAKWLRILGFDVAYERFIEDQDLVRRAKLEQRYILTRDRRLAQRRWSGPIQFMIVQDDHWPGQLRQIIQELKPPPTSLLLTRCIRCNVPLTSFGRKEAEGRVPPYVYRTQKRFLECPSCRRVYWRGTHQKRILRRLKTVFAQDPSGQHKVRRSQ